MGLGRRPSSSWRFGAPKSATSAARYSEDRSGSKRSAGRQPSGLRLTFESGWGIPRELKACESVACELEFPLLFKPADRRRLKALARDRNTPHKHVWRAQIVLLSADGVGTNEIMRRTGKSKTCVWRWQERFMEAGYDSLLRDKTRPSRIPPLASGITERVVTLTQTAPPTEATHWTSAMMAKVVGISASSVQRIWRAHGLQPHR
jgi:transposase